MDVLEDLEDIVVDRLSVSAGVAGRSGWRVIPEYNGLVVRCSKGVEVPVDFGVMYAREWKVVLLESGRGATVLGARS